MNWDSKMKFIDCQEIFNVFISVYKNEVWLERDQPKISLTSRMKQSFTNGCQLNEYACKIDGRKLRAIDAFIKSTATWI